MGEAFITRRGGGSDLNYRVLASTSAPANPKANDIWIKSSTAVNGYRFASVTPSGASSYTGNVYFICSTTYDRTTDNTVPVLNILDKKENGQTIRCLLNLTGCCQVIGGQWTAVNAYLYKGGSWLQFSAEFSATIKVTYPSGSTVTCTNGSTTLTATTTTGSYTFTVPTSGTWTVKAVSGSQSASANVSITTSGESKSVTLSYTVYLYNSGDMCNSVTGGWTTYDSNSTVTNGSTSLAVKANGDYKAGGAKTKNAINMSNHKTLTFKGSVSSGTSFSDFVLRLSQSGTVKATKELAATVSLDISSLSGSYVVELYCANGQSSGRTINVSQIYLTA